MKIAIAAIVKNEATSLLEWIAYHRAVGIENFVLVDNYSTDGTWGLIKGLRRRGLVHAMRFRTLAQKAPQLDAYQKVLKYYGHKYDVLAFIDADEYLTPTSGQPSVAQTIEALFVDEEVSAVALNWACFGSSGKVFKESKLVPQRFVKRAREDYSVNQHYKSLVRPSKTRYFHNPHQVNLTSGRYIQSDGNDVGISPRHQFGLSERICWKDIRLNHYIVKSLEEFLVRKSPAGSSSSVGRTKHRRYFQSHDKNCVEDLSMAPLMEATERELAQLKESLIRPGFQRRLLGVIARVRGWWQLWVYRVRRLWLYGLRR